MRSRYIWTSCRQVSWRAWSAARMSTTVASPVHIKENEPPSLGDGAINGQQTVRMAANNLEDWPFISFLRWRRRELDVASSENLTFDALEYQLARTGAGHPAGFGRRTLPVPTRLLYDRGAT